MNKLEQAARQALSALMLGGLLKKKQAITALRKALAEQEKPLYRKVLREMLDAHEQAEHEIIPSWEEYCECEGIPCEPVKPVDLTDDEIYEVLKRYTKTERYKDDFGSYRAVIAADREKNK